MTVAAISTARLQLVALEAHLAAIAEGRREGAPYSWPAWWPDDEDRRHVELWRERAMGRPSSAWGPRAVVDPATASMVGHAGFHLPPRSIAAALSDPTFAGDSTPSAGDAVEIGYTIFPSERRRGFATEVVDALVVWAFATGEVSTVLATVAESNEASHRVLRGVGGFRVVGTCRDDDGTREIVYRRDLLD